MNSKDPTVTALPSCDGHSHRGLHHYEGLNSYLRRMIHRIDALPGTAPTEERLRITPVE